ncbi:MAG TPA: hypothetical protein VEV39_04150 [Gemmatimonadales bacterium]|nr:hypothetical protein [Gemmatimonadales bacterium]
MSDEALIQTLEHEADLLYQRGKSVHGAAARRLAGALRHAVKEHQVALDEVTRLSLRTKSPGKGPDGATALAFAQAVMRDRWKLVITTREDAQRFLDTPS